MSQKLSKTILNNQKVRVFKQNIHFSITQFATSQGLHLYPENIINLTMVLVTFNFLSVGAKNKLFACSKSKFLSKTVFLERKNNVNNEAYFSRSGFTVK
jgi:hypothetical protein